MKSLEKFLNENGLIVINLISILGVIGSLYYSEVEEFPPCDLCWYGRIFLYPIAIISTIAVLSKDTNINQYILSLSIPGMLVMGYNVLLQETDWFHQLGTCDVNNPCTTKYVDYFGFVTIPFMAFLAFLVITAISGFLLYKKK